MSLWRKGGIKRNYILAVLILIAGFGGLFGYDLYFKPYVLAQPVVKVRSGEGGVLPKNHKLRTEDLYLDTVQTKDVPAGAITKLEQVEQKVTNVNLTEGSILTESLVNIDRLEPTAEEGVFPIPKDAIYAVNGTLRSRDKVDIYLMEGEQQQRMRSEGRPGVVQSPAMTGNAGLPDRRGSDSGAPSDVAGAVKSPGEVGNPGQPDRRGSNSDALGGGAGAAQSPGATGGSVSGESVSGKNGGTDGVVSSKSVTNGSVGGESLTGKPGSGKSLTGDSTTGGSAERGMHRGAELDKLPEEAFLTSVTVNYVRTEDNNDVQDSDQGNTNQRYTSTGKVASPELKLRKEDGQRLKEYLEQGWKLWIVRVE
ncbi:hypothetical protein ACE6ED_11800 [Paenibacillus sp. CN-4]|uniref:hypothetical protein n=1 Tax=Paenibacillus nanchangensis TaxID=3348343 RepID=UPI00397A5FE9